MPHHPEINGKTLLTARLRLRPYEEADLPALHALYALPEVCRFLSRGSADTRADSRARLWRYQQARPYPQGIYAICAREDGALLGTVLLKTIPLSAGESGAEEMEIGWHLHPAAWGKGYATEAAQALLDSARQAGITRIVAVTKTENLPSQAVAKRLQMREMGLTRRYYDCETLLFVWEGDGQRNISPIGK